MERGVTKNWRKSFDCFGVVALLSDLAISVFKAVLYLVMTGLKPNAYPVIADALAVGCFRVAFSACAVINFVSFKSTHGADHVVLRWLYSFSLSHDTFFLIL